MFWLCYPVYIETQKSLAREDATIQYSQIPKVVAIGLNVGFRLLCINVRPFKWQRDDDFVFQYVELSIVSTRVP